MLAKSSILRQAKNIIIWLGMLPKMFKNPSVCGTGKVCYIGDGIISTRSTDVISDKVFSAYKKGVYENTPKVIHKYDYTIYRFQLYHWAVNNALLLEGDMMEIGVWWGVMSYGALEVETNLQGKKFHLVDAYGKSSNDDIDHDSRMPYSKSNSNRKYEDDIYEKVKERFKRKPVVFHRGYVPEILESKEIPDKICFLSLDMNSAKSEYAAINFLWERLVKGCFIYIDDFGCQNHEDTRQMYRSFFDSKNTELLVSPYSSALAIKR